MNEDIVVPVVLFASITIMAIGIPLARAWGRRMERAPHRSSLPAEDTARLERIEHAVDAMSLEIERISEGQRFVTRLLAERTSAADRQLQEESQREQGRG